MTPKEFKKYVRSRDRGTIITKREFPLQKKYKELTKYVDYNCRFKDGACFAYHDDHKSNENKPSMCCCGGCYSTVGWLDTINTSDLPKIARHFSYRTGFWRKGKGCILPRKYRSVTCVTYNCNEYRRFNESIHGTLLKYIRHPNEFRVVKKPPYNFYSLENSYSGRRKLIKIPTPYIFEKILKGEREPNFIHIKEK